MNKNRKEGSYLHILSWKISLPWVVEGLSSTQEALGWIPGLIVMDKRMQQTGSRGGIRRNSRSSLAVFL